MESNGDRLVCGNDYHAFEYHHKVLGTASKIHVYQPVFLFFYLFFFSFFDKKILYPHPAGFRQADESEKRRSEKGRQGIEEGKGTHVIASIIFFNIILALRTRLGFSVFGSSN